MAVNRDLRPAEASYLKEEQVMDTAAVQNLRERTLTVESNAHHEQNQLRQELARASARSSTQPPPRTATVVALPGGDTRAGGDGDGTAAALAGQQQK